MGIDSCYASSLNNLGGVTIIVVSRRQNWMDLLRGWAIILVVGLHATEIANNFQLITPGWLDIANRFFSPYRMPTLMFLSGLLLARSLSKPLRVYYLGKVNMIFWPYLVWCLIYLLVGDSGLPLSNVRSWIATGYLWYIFFLGCYYLGAPLLIKVPSHWLALAALVASIPMPEGMVKYFFYFAGFFFAGHAASTHPSYLHKFLRPKLVIPCMGASMGFGIYSAFAGYRWEGQYAPFCFAGILSLVYVAKKFESFAALRPVRFIGSNSMIFYTTHFPVLILLIGFLARLDGFAGGVAVCVGALGAAAAGILFYLVRGSAPFALLFSGPWSFQRTSSR